MTNEAEKQLGIVVDRKGNVTDGPPCRGRIDRMDGPVECDRVAIAVVEGRSRYKCSYGHRWLREGN